MWARSVDPGVLAVTAERDGGHPFDIAGYPHSVVVGEDGDEHVSIVTGPESLRLDVVTGSVLHGPVSLRVHLSCAGAITFRLAALDRLLRLLDVVDGGRRSPPADRRLPRLVEALHVVDLLAQGARLSQIAAALSPGLAFTSDWPGAGEHRKSKVRRQVALARRLVAAGPAGILTYRA